MSNPLLPPWVAQQRDSLLAQRGHAWLLQGPSGLGQYSLALELVRAWLCDAPTAHGACGQCASCHAIATQVHTDLFVLMPEVLMLELGWPLAANMQDKIDKKELKPSKQIRVEAMRDAVEFSQRTSGRGRGKAVLVYPAERMNHITANALLKTLEEPPGDVKFVLATGAAHQLLPTVRSRCMGHTMVWPDQNLSTDWLQSQGLSATDAPVLLAAAGSRPEDALQWARAGRTAQSWSAIPRAVGQGALAVFADWSPAQIVDALQKLCHDLLLARVGAAPRFFAPRDLPAAPPLAALTQWSKDLNATARVVEHPFNAGLLLESLVGRAQTVLNLGP